jgi:hypothetical protein
MTLNIKRSKKKYFKKWLYIKKYCIIDISYFKNSEIKKKKTLKNI